jgi:ActR/RegA family two-component response regulator
MTREKMTDERLAWFLTHGLGMMCDDDLAELRRELKRALANEAAQAERIRVLEEALQAQEQAEALWVLCDCSDCERSHRPPCHAVENARNRAQAMRSAALRPAESLRESPAASGEES